MKKAILPRGPPRRAVMGWVSECRGRGSSKRRAPPHPAADLISWDKILSRRPKYIEKKKQTCTLVFLHILIFSALNVGKYKTGAFSDYPIITDLFKRLQLLTTTCQDYTNNSHLRQQQGLRGASLTPPPQKQS